MFYNLDVTSKALDATLLRQNIISSNISNVDTPGYKRIDVKFQELLAKQIDANGINEVDIKEIEPSVYTDRAAYANRMDGNNVDVDTEMSELAKTKLRYDTLIQRSIAQISRYKYILQNIK